MKKYPLRAKNSWPPLGGSVPGVAREKTGGVRRFIKGTLAGQIKLVHNVQVGDLH